MNAVKIRKVGGSLMLAVPAAIARQIGAAAGNTVNLEVRGDTMIVRAGRPKYTLAELLAESPCNFQIDEEWDRAPPMGDEVI